MRVFGYGSLLDPGAEPFTLRGWRRTWGVAMDNRVAIAGYKVYEDPDTGERPPVVVVFLDLVPDPAGSVTGALIDRPDLVTLDRRERQYERVEVAPGIVTYCGRSEGRERAARGREEGIAVIQRAYLELVAEPAPPPDLRVMDLIRRDL